MLTIVAPTGPENFQAVMPLNLRLGQHDPIVFGKVDPRRHMVVFTGGSPPEVKRLLCDHIRDQELRNRHSPRGGASRSDRFVQIPTIGRSAGVRLGGDTPSKLSLLAAGDGGDREHVVFATIVGEPHSEVTVYRSDLQYCRVVHCATNGVGDAPSAIMLAIGFNCQHLDHLAVVVKIHNALKSQTEVQVVTPSSIQQLLMQDDEFQSCVRDSGNRLIDATRLKSVGRKGTRRVDWPTSA